MSAVAEPGGLPLREMQELLESPSSPDLRRPGEHSPAADAVHCAPGSKAAVALRPLLLSSPSYWQEFLAFAFGRQRVSQGILASPVVQPSESPLILALPVVRWPDRMTHDSSMREFGSLRSLAV